jgi:hypothetical protein
VANAFIDIFADLHKQRAGYVKQCDDALKIATQYPDTAYGRAMADLCKGLELAIASIDEAIKAG